MMKSVCMTSLFLAVLLTSSGCAGIGGGWTLESITPEDAGQHYSVVKMMLRKDGTYCAMAKRGGEDAPSNGVYTFDDNKLSFTPAEGKTRTYDARLIAFGSKLEVKTTVGDAEVTAIMKRGKCGGGCGSCGKCGKCGKCGSSAKCRCGKPKKAAE